MSEPIHAGDASDNSGAPATKPAVTEDPAERAKRLEWIEKQAYDNIKARFATAEIIAKETQTTLTVLLAGVAGSAAYAATLLNQMASSEPPAPLPLAFAFTCVYLTGLAVWLVVCGMRFKPFPAAHQDPKNLLCPEAEVLPWSELREEELRFIDERIQKAAEINSSRSAFLNLIRLCASLSPLVLVLSFVGAVCLLPPKEKPRPEVKTADCVVQPATGASGVEARLSCRLG